jgi:cobalamin biosynthetic protein CobC
MSEATMDRIRSDKASGAHPMSEATIWHGGDLGEARRLFPGATEPWIDLSTGINPIPYPLPPLAPDLFARLPEPQAHGDLEAAAAEAYGADDAGCVVAAPGTQILISLLPSLRPRGRVAILGPTYAEHARAWRVAGHAVAEVGSLQAMGEVDVAVIVNPNNPDGRLVPADALRGLADRLHRRGGWLVVDEAFADFDAAESLVPALPEGAVVLRSFGKTYGLAGIRLGFAIARGPAGAMLRVRARTLVGVGAGDRGRPRGPAGSRLARDRKGIKVRGCAAPRRAPRLRGCGSDPGDDPVPAGPDGRRGASLRSPGATRPLGAPLPARSAPPARRAPRVHGGLVARRAGLEGLGAARS